jgi:hypothetical protein
MLQLQLDPTRTGASVLCAHVASENPDDDRPTGIRLKIDVKAIHSDEWSLRTYERRVQRLSTELMLSLNPTFQI